MPNPDNRAFLDNACPDSQGPSGEIHPAAAVYPILSDEELDALAADIAANGLRQPIVLTPDGAIIDGRNRALACEHAGVQATYTVYDGDPVAYVLSANEHRRHLTPSQRAMLVVKVEQSAAVQHWTTRSTADEVGVSKSLVAYAVKVAEHAPELVDAVIAGTIPVKRAADEADRQRANRDRTAAEEVDNLRWLEYLRSAYADLAEQYLAGEIGRAEVDDIIQGIELNATTVPRNTVDQVIAAFAALRETISTLQVMAERWQLGSHAARLPARKDFTKLAEVLTRITKGAEP